MVWLAWAGGAFLVWLILVFLFTPGINYHLSHRTAVAHKDFLYTLQSTCQAALHHGNRVTVFTDGPAFYPAMLEAIRGATRSINMECYIFQHGKIASQFIDALSERARNGVNVTIVVDAIGSFSLWGRPVSRLRAAGCRIQSYQAIRWHSLHRMNNRTHRELLVVDGTVAFIGGMGVADQWTREVDGLPAWRDTQIEIRGPAVADVEAGFDQNWILTGGEVDPPVPPREPPAGDARSIVVWSAPQGGASGMKLLYLLALASARREVDVESPYLITDASSAWSIQDARRRGVRIRLLVDGDRTDAKMVKYASRAQYERLLEEGVDIAEYQPTMMHAKTMVVDGLLSVVGSANFDNRSLELNDELNVAAFDPALASRLLEDFTRDWTESKRLELQAWRSRPLFARDRDWIWSAFGEVF